MNLSAGAEASCGLVQMVEAMMACDPTVVPHMLDGVIAGVGFLGGYDVAAVLTAFMLLTFWAWALLKLAEKAQDEGSAGADN